MRLALYLVGSLIVAIAAGLLVAGPERWSWGVLAWLCASALACLLYFEQKGHPWTLVAPGTLLLSILLLKAIARW